MAPGIQSASDDTQRVAGSSLGAGRIKAPCCMSHHTVKEPDLLAAEHSRGQCQAGGNVYASSAAAAKAPLPGAWFWIHEESHGCMTGKTEQLGRGSASPWQMSLTTWENE